VSFTAITLHVASQRVFIIVAYFVIDSVRKLLDIASYIHAFLSSALDGGDLSVSRLGRFTPCETAHGTDWIRGWVDLTAVWTWWRREKHTFSAPTGNRTPAVYSLTSHYTN
jgi:hypothetical protein